MEKQPQSKEELLQRAKEQGWDVYEQEGRSEKLYYFEDDGHFHLEHYGVRVSPDMLHGQGSSRRDFDREVNRHLRDMGYKVNYKGSGLV
jgi:hypothetical protein